MHIYIIYIVTICESLYPISINRVCTLSYMSAGLDGGEGGGRAVVSAHVFVK